MPGLSKIAEKHNNYTSAYDERKRLFDALRNPDLSDEERDAAEKDYKTAALDFDKQRKAIVGHPGA